MQDHQRWACLSRTHIIHPSLRNHLSHSTQGTMCMVDGLSPSAPSAYSCPSPTSVSPWKERGGGGGRAFSSIRKHLFHLDSCLSRRRASGTGCPRGDCTERRLMPAESHLMPWSPVSYPVQHQDSDYFLAKSAQGHD